MESTNPTQTNDNEKPLNENSKESKTENSDHKYNANKDHLKNCLSCQQEKKKINDLYYENNKDRILQERKAERELKNKKFNEAINDLSTNKNAKLNLSDREIIEANCIPIQTIDPDNFIFKQESKYIFPKNLERIISKTAKKLRSKGLILIGHAGSGKSESAKAYARKNKIPLVFSTLHSNISSTDLLGSFTLKDQTSVFVLGDLPKAVEIANTHKSKTCMLVLDEINTMTNDIQKILNENLNFRSGINIPLVNKTYRLNEDSKIIVIATMNYSSYTGTFILNSELNSRFDHVKVTGLNDKQLRDLLKSENIDDQTIESLLITYKESIKAFEENKISMPLDIRGLMKFCEDYNLNKTEYQLTHEDSLKESLELTLAGRYLDNKDELNFISQIIESNFKVKVDP